MKQVTYKNKEGEDREILFIGYDSEDIIDYDIEVIKKQGAYDIEIYDK